MTYKYMSTQELCNAIYEAVFAATEPLTRRQIAETIGKKKVPHVVKMIEHLTASGYFEKREITDKFGRQAFVYVAARRGENACEEAA